MPITIYGIKNCETMNKARPWLDEREHRLCVSRLQDRGHRSRATGKMDQEGRLGDLLNRAGTTFRKLPEKDREGINEKKAIALMLAQPSMIKRPVLDLADGKLTVGFKPETFSEKVTARG